MLCILSEIFHHRETPTSLTAQITGNNVVKEFSFVLFFMPQNCTELTAFYLGNVVTEHFFIFMCNISERFIYFIFYSFLKPRVWELCKTICKRERFCHNQLGYGLFSFCFVLLCFLLPPLKPLALNNNM